MKRNMLFVGWVIALLCMVVSTMEVKADCMNPKSCEEVQYCLSAPEYYCACHDATQFYYGLDTIIPSDMWFKATLEQLQNGMMAYWQSEDTALMEVYAFCASVAPTMTRKINPHSSVYITPQEVKTLSQQIPGGMMQDMVAYMHFVSMGEHSGRAICFSGTEGAISTCEDALEFNPYSNYAFKGNQVFDLHFRTKPNYVILRYRNQEDMSKPVSLKVHYGTCDGPVVAEHLFTDSMKPYFVPVDIAQKAYKEDSSLYMDFTNYADTGLAHIYYRSWTRFLTDTVDTAICIGKGLELTDTILRLPTIYRDSICNERFKGDTIFVHQYNLQFTDADTIERTVKIKGTKIPYLYQDQVFRNYGDYVYRVTREGECDQVVFLHLVPDYTVKRLTVDTTLCQGLTFQIGSQKRTTNGTVRDTVYSGKYLDTQTITTYRVKFSAPVLEYDTIAIHSAVLPYKYYGSTIRQFGETTVTIRQKDECTRKVQLLVLENDGTLTYTRQTKDTIGCSSDGIQFQDSLIFESMVYVDSIYTSDTTMLITSWTVKIQEAGEVQHDTIAVEEAELPYTWSGHAIEHYGETEIEEQVGACQTLTKLQVVPRYLVIETDTTICEGKTIEVNDTIISTTTTYEWTVPQTKYTDQKYIYKVTVTPAEARTEELHLTEADLPYTYNTETIITEAGTYTLNQTDEDGCEAVVSLLVDIAAAAPKIVGDGWRVIPSTAAVGQTIKIVGLSHGNARLLDALGRCVREWQMSNVANEFNLNQRGMYLLVLSNDEGQQTIKIIIK